MYPSNHPIVLAPSLAGDAMSYEDMLRLAELIGNHKPPTVTADDIANSELQVIKAEEVRTYEEQGKIMSLTADKCLGKP